MIADQVHKHAGDSLGAVERCLLGVYLETRYKLKAGLTVFTAQQSEKVRWKGSTSYSPESKHKLPCADDQAGLLVVISERPVG
jgi:hypothetical protein